MKVGSRSMDLISNGTKSRLFPRLHLCVFHAYIVRVKYTLLCAFHAHNMCVYMQIKAYFSCVQYEREIVILCVCVCVCV